MIAIDDSNASAAIEISVELSSRLHGITPSPLSTRRHPALIGAAQAMPNSLQEVRTG